MNYYFCIFKDFYGSGMQDAKVTKSLRLVFKKAKAKRKKAKLTKHTLFECQMYVAQRFEY